MTTTRMALTELEDAELLAAVTHAAANERSVTVQLIVLLSELDARRLYLREGCASLFTYCTQVLHLSEHAAYGRITAARAARRFPNLLTLLEEGAITLTTVGLIAPYLTLQNADSLLTIARHQSKREVEQIVAALRPQPPQPSAVRAVPASAAVVGAYSSGAGDQPVADSGPPSNRSAASDTDPDLVDDPGMTSADGNGARVSVTTLSPEHYRVHITISRETHEDLRRAQDLLRHVVPTGDPAAIFSRALRLLVKQLERTRMSAVSHPRASRGVAPGSRRITAAVRRQVWARDEGRCAFVGSQGRCTERGFLEVHHLKPFAAGGASTVQNLELRCRAHNVYEAEKVFGPWTAREARCRYDSNSVRTESSCSPGSGAKDASVSPGRTSSDGAGPNRASARPCKYQLRGPSAPDTGERAHKSLRKEGGHLVGASSAEPSATIDGSRDAASSQRPPP